MRGEGCSHARNVEIEKGVVSDVEGKLPGGGPFVILEKCVARLYFRPAGQIG